MSRRVLQAGLSVAMIFIVGLFSINYFIRVSDGVHSHGIVEDWFFGRSFVSSIFRSNEFNNWNDANDLSERLASLLTERGTTLLTDPQLSSERKVTARQARRAYELSSVVPEGYLAASNQTLPVAYQEHFVQAMRLWAEGLEKSDPGLIQEGILHYNAFLQWIQTQDRNNFKRLK